MLEGVWGVFKDLGLGLVLFFDFVKSFSLFLFFRICLFIGLG